MSNAVSWQRLSSPCGDSGPRVGRLATPHGAVETPAFIPVGTKATVKGVRPETLREVGVEMVLANTYHLALRPGAETLRQLGGLHAVMGWDGPILTDSGGFQVFSLARLRKVTQDGVTFRNHIDGAEMTLTPETAVAVQNELGADIIMALDVCPPYPCPRPDVEEAVRLTIEWAARSRAAHGRADQALWGIVQGGVEKDLRQRCAAELVAMDFPGYAIGGVSVGEGHDHLREVLGWTAPLLPAGRPRYLMGVGEPRDVVAAVAAGIDLFDCVLPTRNGRNACAFTFEGMMRLRNEVFKADRRPIEEDCDCPACRRFSRGALRHLFAAGEMLGPILLSIHNLRFFTRFFGRMRQAVREGRFDAAAQALLDRYYKNG
ncbi:MAG: tRNA guanosine(34) transglycosylase Tgt [Planctomycetes bacterium]|nr:tRNA guanosine(34) transglycosylase Tgt [Planctomycetota bacterium]